MIKQSTRLKLIFTLIIISVFQFFTPCSLIPKLFRQNENDFEQKMEDWLNKTKTIECRKDYSCTHWMYHLIKREKEKTDKSWLYKIITKLTNKFDIIVFRKKIIDEYIPKLKHGTIYKREKEKNKSIKFLHKTYLDMPDSDKPNDYDTITSYFEYCPALD